MTALSSRRGDADGPTRLIDVARAASVSLKTASRVMNGSEAVSEAVRERAYELAQEHPDASAEENWLRAERELFAHIKMSVYGHP